MLPERFKFYIVDDSRIVYTAKLKGDKYILDWIDEYKQNFIVSIPKWYVEKCLLDNIFVIVPTIQNIE